MLCQECWQTETQTAGMELLISLAFLNNCRVSGQCSHRLIFEQAEVNHLQFDVWYAHTCQ